ncbi:Drug resistance transporter, Bcr/CflA subfamily [uncultured Pleomorphomonas sp.]|uniref:Bcr/CflA family efflux transporter n=1 Tax=uncultured Pleomorphomonas sp. TaxID=442121 RepID=A0A212LLS5_9HYPH|nr:multidrug effflux MFS transporter [uncultured Pleomorphomonas sp.]SCM78476.1 Drug resistance transporter, Bcr/CflA subfamily [uncultured Pleomorphomonas sp.]
MQHAPMTERHVAAIGSLLIALGPVSLALYTPAMPELVSDFATTYPAVKATLAAYFAGFALAQLICGPLSDAYGRRPAALAFLTLYAAGSIGAMLAPSIQALTVARLIQGTGAAVGISVARAIVRDNFTGEQSARVMNTIGIFLAIGPAVAPTLGSLAMLAFDWRAIFVLMVVYGGALLVAVHRFLPETNRAPDPARASPAGLVRAYAALGSDGRFLFPALMLGLVLGGFYSLSSMLPFLLIDIAGLSPQAFGFGMLGQTGAYIVGGIVTKALLKHVPARHLVLPGLGFAMAGALAMTASVALWPSSYLTVMTPVALFAFALAMVTPDLTTRAMAAFPEKAGAAAALLGFAQMGSGFVASGAVAMIGSPPLAFAMVIPVVTLAALLLGFTERERD